MRSIHISPGYRRAGMLAGLVFFITGCASGLSKEECHLADWRSIGYEDGIQGRSEARIGEHRKACAKYGVESNFEAYQYGWEEGVSRYCQPGNGFSQGRAGKRYLGVCPEAQEPGFLHAYRQGRKLYDLEADLRKIERSLATTRKRLSAIEVEMRDTGIALVKEGATTEQRVIMLDELRKLEHEREQAQARIPSLEAERQRKEQRLAAARNQYRY